MAVKLFRLVMAASTSTNAVPTVSRFFNTNSVNLSGTKIILLKSKFVKDNGNVATALTMATSNNGYYLLFVDGQLQQANFYTVAASQVTLQASTAFTIRASAPVTLSVTNFAPTSSTIVTS